MEDDLLPGSRKLVFAPFGSDSCGEDILNFEHGLLFALERAVETAGGFVLADIHDKVGGPEKKDRPMPAFTESELSTLCVKSACDALIDGMLLVQRDSASGTLREIAVALRVTFPKEHRIETPEAFTFRAFGDGGLPEQLTLDYDLFVALQYRLAETLLDILDTKIPRSFTTDTLQITESWPAYLLFLKARRIAQIPEEKLGFYEQICRTEPNCYWALFNSAMLYRTQTDYHSARSKLMKAISATNDPVLLGDSYFEAGLCSIYLGDTKTARNFWAKALEVAGDNPTLLVNIAGTYEQEENWNEAIRLNEEALKLAPDTHKAIVNLGRLHAMFGRLEEAIPLYKRALALQPDDALRHSVLGGCYLAAGRETEAIPHFERAVELDPDGDPGRYAAQELLKLAPPSEPEVDKKRRFGLF